MVQPPPAITPDPVVVEAIELTDRAGACITDTEVAALAAGVLAPTDLVVPVVNGVSLTSNADSGQQQQQHDDTKKAAKVKIVVESDEESSEEEERQNEEETAPAGIVGAAGGEPQQAERMEVVEDQMDGEKWTAANKGKGKDRVDGDETVAAAAAGGGAVSQPDVMEVEAGEEEVDEVSDDVSSESDGGPEPPRRKKNPHLPLTGPLSTRPMGDVSDGEEEEFMSSAVPMTKHEEVEPILPLGEVSLDGAEVQEVGKIVSLVEADGTIVVQGKPGLVLDEGCVLGCRVVERQADGALGTEGPTEPLGRIHEIFGPCALPHYTVRVEGAATQHQLVNRYQVALKKLLQEEKERVLANKAELDRIAEEEAVAAALLDPVIAADRAAAAAEAAQKAADTLAAATLALARENTVAHVREHTQRRAREKKKPNPNNDEKLEALRKLVDEAETAMGALKQHPFSRWQVGAAVYALKDAQILPKEKILEDKGTDASNLHDEEADEEEFSDDEQEKMAKSKGKENKKREDLAMQGVLPDEIDAIIAKEEDMRRQKKAKRDAANGYAKDASGARGGRGRGRGGGGRARGRGGRGGRGGRNNGNQMEDVPGHYVQGGDRGDGGLMAMGALQQQAGYPPRRVYSGFAPSAMHATLGGVQGGLGVPMAPRPLPGRGYPPQQQQQQHGFVPQQHAPPQLAGPRQQQQGGVVYILQRQQRGFVPQQHPPAQIAGPPQQQQQQQQQGGLVYVSGGVGGAVYPPQGPPMPQQVMYASPWGQQQQQQHQPMLLQPPFPGPNRPIYPPG